MTRPPLPARVHPGILAIMTRKADELNCSLGDLVEMMAAQYFGPHIPAGYRPGELVPDDWRKRWGLPDDPAAQGERH
jgi:hypothetical protein